MVGRSEKEEDEPRGEKRERRSRARTHARPKRKNGEPNERQINASVTLLVLSRDKGRQVALEGEGEPVGKNR